MANEGERGNVKGGRETDKEIKGRVGRGGIKGTHWVGMAAGKKKKYRGI